MAGRARPPHPMPTGTVGTSDSAALCDGVSLRQPKATLLPAEVVSLPCANQSPAQPPSHLHTRHRYCSKTEVRGSTQAAPVVPVSSPHRHPQSPGLLSVLLSKELRGGWHRAGPGASVLFLVSGGGGWVSGHGKCVGMHPARKGQEKSQAGNPELFIPFSEPAACSLPVSLSGTSGQMPNRG